MRVVSGIAGGRRLQAPAGRQLRPTTERVREAVFSSLWSLGVLEGARVLDLYAGSGAMGIEALSRGAASATFVEADPVAARTIEANLAATGLAGPATRVAHVDVARFLDDPGDRFDLAFVDPPYAFSDWPSVLGRLPVDLAVLESRREVDPGPAWMTTRSARYGGTVVTTVQRTETDQNGGAER